MNRTGDRGVSGMRLALRQQLPSKRDDDMDEEDDEIAHFLIITKPGIARG